MSQFSQLNTQITLLFLVIILFCLPSCEEGGNGMVIDMSNEPIVGKWLSTDHNLAILASDTLISQTLTFNLDSTYNLLNVSLLDDSTTYIGTYKITKQTETQSIIIIDIMQEQPTTLTYSGIYEVNEILTPNELVLETVQVVPDIGHRPPNESDGFGSSNNGNLGAENIQIFERVKD